MRDARKGEGEKGEGRRREGRREKGEGETFASPLLSPRLPFSFLLS